MEIKPYVRVLPGLVLATDGIRRVERNDEALVVEHDGMWYSHTFPDADEAKAWEESVLRDLTPEPF